MMADQTIARVGPVRTDAYYDVFQMLTGVGLVAFMSTSISGGDA